MPLNFETSYTHPSCLIIIYDANRPLTRYLKPLEQCKRDSVGTNKINVSNVIFGLGTGILPVVCVKLIIDLFHPYN